MVLSLSSAERLIQAGVKSVFTVLVKKNDTEESDLIKIFNKFGADICQALPFFHAFSGCDTSSSFYVKRKSIFWMHGCLSSSQLNLCIHLLKLATVHQLYPRKTRLLELFILYVYFGKNHRYTDINEARCTSFFKSPDLKLKDTVLSKDALIEHIKRSAYRAGWLWRESFDNVVLPGPERWGWKPYFELCTKYFPRWHQEDSQTTIQVLCQHVGVRRATA